MKYNKINEYEVENKATKDAMKPIKEIKRSRALNTANQLLKNAEIRKDLELYDTTLKKADNPYILDELRNCIRAVCGQDNYTWSTMTPDKYRLTLIICEISKRLNGGIA